MYVVERGFQTKRELQDLLQQGVPLRVVALGRAVLHTTDPMTGTCSVIGDGPVDTAVRVAVSIRDGFITAIH